jgi:hypothetical protein
MKDETENSNTKNLSTYEKALDLHKKMNLF